MRRNHYHSFIKKIALLLLLQITGVYAVKADESGDSTKKYKRLQEFEVIETKTVNEKPVSFGKMHVKPMDMPQSSTVISHDILERQQVLTLGDALQNVNGVYIMSTSGGTQQEIAGRGYAFGSSNTFKNGVRYNNGIIPEASSLERIEVLKGSAAILYGNVAAGGVLNIITKKPKFAQGGEVSMRFGSYDLYKPSFDIYGAVNNSKHLAYRLNGTYEKAGSFRDNVHSERFYINPSFLIKIGERTDVLLEGDYLKDHRTLDYGTGAIDYVVADIPRERFLGVSWAYNKAEQQSATMTITHHLNHQWQITSKTGYQNYNNDLFGNARPNASGNMVSENGDWQRTLQRSAVDEEYYITQLDLTGSFHTGFLKHQLLVGADIDKYNTETTRYNAVDYDSINIYDLNKYQQRNDIPSLDKNTITTNPVSRAGVYVQDLISIMDNVKLLAGIRYTSLNSESDVYTAAKDATAITENTDHAWTPRLGIVYQPWNNISLFASYSNSFTLNSGTDIDNKALPPSYINQYEAGVKTDLINGLLSANLTFYQIVNSNLAQTSLQDPTRKELAGEVTSKGIELDVMTKSFHGFSLIAGYSYNDTRYTKSNTYIVGSRLRYNPSHTANARLYYEFDRKSALNGFNLGIGAYYVGERVGGRSTTKEKPYNKLMALPDFTLFDASVGYTYDRISVRLKMTNLFDKLSYYVHDDNSVNPIAPRLFAATVSYKF